jgi:hypothetical protein
MPELLFSTMLALRPALGGARRQAIYSPARWNRHWSSTLPSAAAPLKHVFEKKLGL